MTTQRSLDERAPRALIPTCPKCGARLYPVTVDGVITGFSSVRSNYRFQLYRHCIGCEELYKYEVFYTQFWVNGLLYYRRCYHK